MNNSHLVHAELCQVWFAKLIWLVTVRDPQMVCHQKKFGNQCCMVSSIQVVKIEILYVFLMYCLYQIIQCKSFFHCEKVMKNDVVVKIFCLHYCCDPPPAESRGMNKTNGHHHLHTPCGLQIQHKVNYVLCLLSTFTKKCSIANSNTKFCDYTIMGVAKGALGPWSPYIVSYFAANDFCQHCKRSHYG